MYWKTTLFALGLAVGLAAPRASLSHSAAQEGRKQTEEEREARERKRQTAERRLTRNVETLRHMQGGWLLSELSAAKLRPEGRQDIAYLLIAEEFMALEIHMGYFDEGGREEESYLQSGIYRLNFNIYGDLIAKLLIGTLDIGFGNASPRQPGMTSVYEVHVAEGRLVMTSSEDGKRFEWTKLKTGALTQRLYEELDWLAQEEGAREEVSDDEPGVDDE